MELTEDRIFQAFGLEQKSTGENEPAVAEQADEGKGSGTEKELSTPALRASAHDDNGGASQEDGEGDDPSQALRASSPQRGEPSIRGEQREQDAEDGDDGEDPEQGNNPGGNGEQSLEERRANAARRRQQEQQEAIRTAVQQALQERDRQQAEEMKNFFENAKLSNPITGEPIRSMEDFRAWQTAQENARIEQELKDGKLTTETLTSLIDRTPAMQEMRRRQEQQAAAARQAQEAEQMREVERQLQEIRKVDPSIKTVGDLMHRPYSKAFYEAVQRGNNFEDAFYLATRKQREEATAERAQQAAANNIRSKDHLRATSIGGKAGANITPEEERYYRLFNPKATQEEIQRFQNKYKKQ